MADSRERDRQFDYSVTSSKVISGERTRVREPTGEAETLRGRVSAVMGDKAFHAKPDLPKSEKVEVVERERPTSLAPVRPKGLLYYPRLRETRDVYESLLNMCQPLLGDQPDDVIKGALDEILASLKAENVQETVRKQEMEAILGPLSAEDFSKYFSLSKQLIDYQVRTETVQSEAAEDVQIPVVFESEGARRGEDRREVQSSEEEELPDQMELDQGDDVGEEAERRAEKRELDPNDIDAFWLWRQLEKAFNSVEFANSLEGEVLTALSSPDRICENMLVQALGFERLDLIRLLLANKFEVVQCTRMNRAKTEEDKAEIRTEWEQLAKGRDLMERMNLAGKPVKKQKVEKVTDRVTQADVEATTRNLIDLKQLELNYAQRISSLQDKVLLPPGSKETSHKGFEELFIPAPLPHPHSRNICNQTDKRNHRRVHPQRRRPFSHHVRFIVSLHIYAY